MRLQQEEIFEADVEDFREITHQSFFEHPLRPDSTRFFLQNRILSNPDAILSFFKYNDRYSQYAQISLLKQIQASLDQVSTNARFLALIKDPPSDMELIEFILPWILNQEELQIKTLLMSIINHIFKLHSLPDKLLKQSLKQLVLDFYQSKVQTDRLQTTAEIVQSIFQNKTKQDRNQPNQVMVFHGSNNNYLQSNNNIGWIFGKGFTFATWIKIDYVRSKPNAPLGKILTFHAEGIGGIQIFMANDKLFYRQIGPNYSQPLDVMAIKQICTIKTNQWQFLAIEQTQPTGPRLFSKIMLKIYLGKKLQNSIPIDPPKPNPTHPTKIGFFNNLYCQTSQFCLFLGSVGSTRIDEMSKNQNSIELQKEPKALVFKERNEIIFERRGFAWINSKQYSKNRKIQSHFILPFFYLLRFINAKSKKPINELFDLVSLFLVISPEHQHQAEKNNFFEILGNLICDIDYDPSDDNTLKMLISIKESITNQRLLDKYISELLWKLLNSKFSIQRKIQIFSIIKVSFIQMLSHCSQLLGLDNILNFLAKFQSRQLTCCEQHQQVIDRFGSFTIDSKEKKFFLDILDLLELLFMNLDMKTQLVKMMRLLLLKFSPCLQLSFLRLIRNIISERLNARTTSSSLRNTLLTLFTVNKIHLIFFQLIQTSQFIDVRSQAIKLLFFFNSHKISPIDQAEIAAYVSQEKLLKLINNRKTEPTIPINSLKEIPSEAQSPTKSFNIFPSGSPSSGPQAPGMRNSRKPKGAGRFQFPVIIQEERQRIPLIIQTNQVQQEQKTSEPEFSLVLPPSRKKGNNIKPFLTIDTEQINQDYDRQMNPTSIDEDEERQQIQKIRELALKCLRAMNKQDEVIRQVTSIPAPLSVREKKSIVFPTAVRAPLLSTRNQDFQKRNNRRTFQDLKIQEQSEFSGSKKSSGVISIDHKTTPKMSPSQKKHRENLIMFYSCLLEMVFQQSNIKDIHTPPPKISSMNCLYILLTWTLESSPEIKKQVLDDLSTIIQSRENLLMLAESEQVLKFLIIMVQHSVETNNINLLSDSHQLLKKISTEIFFNNPKSDERLLLIVNWPNKIPTRYFWKIVLDGFEDYRQYNSRFPGNLTIKQKNFTNICLLTEQLIYFGNDESEPKLMYTNSSQLPSLMKEIFSSSSQWIDQIIVQKLLRIFNTYFASPSYSQRKKNLSDKSNDKAFIQSIFKRSKDYSKEVQYLMGEKGGCRGPLFSLVSIYSTFVEVMNSSDVAPIEAIQSLLALVKLLFVFPIIMPSSEFKNKKSQIFQTLSFAFKVLIQDNRQQLGEEIFNYIALIKEVSILQTGGEQVSRTNNKFIEEFLQTYFHINADLFQTSFIESCKELRALTKKIPQIYPNKLTFDERRISSRLMGLSQSKKKQYQVQLYKFIPEAQEYQKDRQHHVSILEEAYSRRFKRQYKSVWKRLRMYDSIWAHPAFYFQNDDIFSKTAMTFQRMKDNYLYDLRVNKHETKSRARFFLTPRLKQPDIVGEDSQLNKLSNNKLTSLEQTFKLTIKPFSLNKHIQDLLSQWNDDRSEYNLMTKAQIVNTLSLRQGFLSIAGKKLIFIYSNYEEEKSHLCMLSRKMDSNSALYKQWPLEHIKEIQRRRFMNQKTALQIFFVSGKSIFLNFPNGDSSQISALLFKLRKKYCHNIIYYDSLSPRKIIQSSAFTKKWNSYELSNFQYLMQLNCFSGRTYRDISQYPVLPWIVTSFASQLNLSAVGSYRDLKKNVGSLGSEARIQCFKERYEGLRSQQQPFHFGTHYSSPGIIFHYLVRLSPYTQGLKILQSGHFDLADRMFYSIKDSYKNCITEQSDVRELIPQFYTIPQMFLNINHCDFGLMQTKQRVHNVELPLWSKDNPYLYVSILRKAIESNYVSSNLNNWIDLIFGYKQRGEEARRNLNTFVHVTYQDAIDFSELDPKQKLSIETQVLNFGQTPSLLFIKPHIQRAQPPSNIFILSQNMDTKVYRPPQKKSLSSKLETNPMMFDGKAIIKLKETKDSSKDSRLTCVYKDGRVITYKWSSQTQSQIPFQCIIDTERKFSRLNKDKFKQKYDANEFYDASLNPEAFPVQVIKGGEIMFVGGLHEGRLLVIGSDDSSFQSQVKREHHDTISVLKCEYKDNFLISGDMRGEVIVWRILQGKLNFQQRYSDHSKEVTSIFISSELKVFATSSLDGSVHVYNLITGKKMRSYFHPKKRPLNNVVIATSPLASVILFCQMDRMILSYSINGQLLKTIVQKFSKIFVPSVIKYQRGIQYLAYGSEKGQVVIRDIPFLDKPRVFAVAKDAAVTGISISKDLKFLICCCSDGELSVVAPSSHQRHKTT